MFFKLSITHEFKYKYRLTANLCCHHYCISISNYLWEKKMHFKEILLFDKGERHGSRNSCRCTTTIVPNTMPLEYYPKNFGAAQEMNLLCLQHHLQMIFYLFFRFVFHTFAFCSYMTHITSKN